MRRFLLSPRGLGLLLVELSVASGLSLAQTTFERAYGGSKDDEGRSVQQTSDGGFIIAGNSASFGAGSKDVYLIKTNSLGDTIWMRTYGGVAEDYGSSVQQTSDGGYIIAGYTYSLGYASSDICLIKTNTYGDTLWSRMYGGPGFNQGHSVQQTSDGGYIVAGYTEPGDIYLLKTNSSGDTLWTRRYGPGYARSVQQTSDGGYVIAGHSSSSNNTGGGYVCLIKTNSSGDTLWMRTYGGGLDLEYGSSVQQTTDGGYIIVGTTYPSWAVVYLVRTNSVGNILWTRSYGGTGYPAFGNSVQQTSDGGYIIAGSNQISGGTFPNYRAYLVKTNSSGDTLWTRLCGGPTTSEEGWSVRQTSDGGYIITGQTARPAGAAPNDLYVIKTDANGRVTAEGIIDSLFSPRVELSTGSYPWSTTAADFDGDGKVDLAATVYDENVVALFRNVGTMGSLSTGSFAERVTFPTGTGPTGIASGDFDSDGKADLAISNAVSGTVSIFRNTSVPGTIQFAARNDLLVGKDPKGLAVGDLDSDGSQDIAVPNEGESSISILRNIGSVGSIAFSALPPITVELGPLKAVIADLNRDGLEDLAVVNNGSSSISLLRNRSIPGIIIFDSPVAHTTGEHYTGSAPGRMAVADIDGDDAADLIVDNINDGTVELCRNRSSSAGLDFFPGVQIPTGNQPWCVGAGDFNGDGKTDVAATNYQDSTVTIFLNRSQGAIITPFSLQNVGTLGTGADPLNVEVNDLDGDGKPDLVIACRGSNTLSLFQNVSAAMAIPAPVALVAPRDNAVVGKDSVHFSWRPASSGVGRYRWELATDSLFSNPVIDSGLTGTSKVIYALTAGQTYWWKVAAQNAMGWGPFSPSNRFTTLLTDVSETQDIPDEFSLSQNYPNPFNPRTVVSSQLPVASNVKLVIYDVLGREVAVLVNERRAVGRYRDTFDGSGLSSGIYICRLTAGSYVQSMKMLLVK